MSLFAQIIQEIKQHKKITYYFSIAIGSVILFSCLPDFHPDRYISNRYHTRGDLWIHAGAYCITALVGFLILQESKLLVVLNLFLLLIFSVLMEFVQILVPNRGFSWLDMASNAIGIFVAGLLTFILYRIRGKAPKSEKEIS